MRDYENVECKRCGERWFSRKFDEEEELPSYCPTCYQKSVQEIPPPPSKKEILEEKLQKKNKEVIESTKKKKHQTKLFIQNNKMLISMANMGLMITLLIGLLIYFLFLQ